MRMATVTFDHVFKRFPGDVIAVNDLNLHVADGEFLVLVGPSGCGKTTALRCIAGLETISDGKLSIGDQVVNDVAPKDRDIAMVFQSYALYPHMTVRENLEFGLKLRKTPPAEMDRLVTEAAEILGIKQLLERKPKQLSGGQRQRVAVGRAMVRKPSVFLFDEPLSNLDAKLRVQMRAEISKLQQRLRTTTIYVTHDQVEAMTMGHRISVMNEGKIMQVGTPLELYERPQNVFVANFIGTPPMNFVRGVLADGGTRIAASKYSLTLPAGLRGMQDGRKVVAGIRPENVGDASMQTRGETARLPGEVEIVEPLGHEVIVHAKVGDDLLVAKTDPHHTPQMGAPIELVLELDALHLFDATTEGRMGREEKP